MKGLQNTEYLRHHSGMKGDLLTDIGSKGTVASPMDCNNKRVSEQQILPKKLNST